MQLNLTWPEGIPTSHISTEFIQGMLDRMAMSYFKYGAVDESIKKTNPLASARLRVEKYCDTGNTEWLMDAANYIMIEFMVPSHPEAHFRVTEGDESPGNVLLDGTTSAAHKRDL